MRAKKHGLKVEIAMKKSMKKFWKVVDNDTQKLYTLHCGSTKHCFGNPDVITKNKNYFGLWKLNRTSQFEF